MTLDGEVNRRITAAGLWHHPAWAALAAWNRAAYQRRDTTHGP